MSFKMPVNIYIGPEPRQPMDTNILIYMSFVAYWCGEHDTKQVYILKNRYNSKTGFVSRKLAESWAETLSSDWDPLKDWGKV